MQSCASEPTWTRWPSQWLCVDLVMSLDNSPIQASGTAWNLGVSPGRPSTLHASHRRTGSAMPASSSQHPEDCPKLTPPYNFPGNVPEPIARIYSDSVQRNRTIALLTQKWSSSGVWSLILRLASTWVPPGSLVSSHLTETCPEVDL